MKQIEGGVTAAKGYTTAGTRAGIKKGKTKRSCHINKNLMWYAPFDVIVHW